VPGVPGAAPQGWVVQAQAGDASASFGIFGSGEKGSEAVNKLTASLQEFAERLGETLKRAIEDAAHLEVETYVADDLASVNYHAGDFSAAQLRAVTRMALDGDTQVVVPRRGEQLDAELWAIHTSMVQQAQTNRAEMIRAIAAAAAGLFGALK
jgi:lantibiotic modifying enzyme